MMKISSITYTREIQLGPGNLWAWAMVLVNALSLAQLYSLSPEMLSHRPHHSAWVAFFYAMVSSGKEIQIPKG